MTEDGTSKRNRWVKHAIGFCITLVCIVAVVRQVNVTEVADALSRFEWNYLFFGIASLALGYALRIKRWSLMLSSTGVPVSFGTCAAPFLGAIALNNVLPLRLGDFVRALVFPKAMGITKTTATSSLVVERLVDLMTLLACFAAGLYMIQAVAVPLAVRKSAVSLAFFGGVLLTLGILFSGRLGGVFSRLASTRYSARGKERFARIFSTLGGLLSGFETMSRPRLLLIMLFVSMLIWVGESGLFYFVLLGLGFDANPTVALLVMSVATLSTLAPSSPGYVGPFHLAAFTAVTALGGSSAQAGSYAVLVHLALWLSTTLAGAAAISLKPELFKAVRNQAN